MSKLAVVTIHPVQQVAAEPQTLDLLTARLRAQLSERLEQPVATNQMGDFFGWPLVADPALPPGIVYLRPFPQPPQPEPDQEGGDPAMTAHPIPENGHCWWLVSGKERRLHAIPGRQITPEAMRDATDEVRTIPASAACGIHRRWWMPGLFSRLGRRRCIPCCRALDIPAGYGTPANENHPKENDRP